MQLMKPLAQRGITWVIGDNERGSFNDGFSFVYEGL